MERLTYPLRAGSSPLVSRKTTSIPASQQDSNGGKQEIAKEDRERIAPLHEIGAGAPCLKCGDACPGLDLHFWRKICRNCKCSQSDHDIKPEKKEQQRKIGRLFGEDEISHYNVSSLVIERTRDPKSPHAKIESVTFEWVPTGATESLVNRYMDMIPEESQPIAGTKGAQQRDQQMMKQLPAHDQAPEFCDNLSEVEAKKLEEFVEQYKTTAVGIGQVREVIIQDLQPQTNTALSQQAGRGVYGTAAPLSGDASQRRSPVPGGVSVFPASQGTPVSMVHSQAVQPGVRGASGDLRGHQPEANQQYASVSGVQGYQAGVAGQAGFAGVEGQPGVGGQPGQMGHVQYQAGQEGAVPGQFASEYGTANIQGTPAGVGHYAGQSGVVTMHGTPEGVAGEYGVAGGVGGVAGGRPGEYGTPGAGAGVGGRPGQYATQGGVSDIHGTPGGVAGAYGAGDVVDTTRHGAGAGATPGVSAVGGGEIAEQALAPHWQCVQCGEQLTGGDVAVFAERAGPDKCWHPACFRCDTCKELLVDLIYFYKDDKVYCGRHYADLHRPRCAACDELIFAREYTQAEDQNWHLKHFCCFDCDVLLGGKRYVPRDNHPYCLECYEKRFAKICQSCHEKISADAQRLSHKEFHWHANEKCFSCSNCKTTLLGKQFMPKQGHIFCSVKCKRELLS
ncbi:testin-like isoform X2 [Glandiceps talaboti]